MLKDREQWCCPFPSSRGFGAILYVVERTGMRLRLIRPFGAEKGSLRLFLGRGGIWHFFYMIIISIVLSKLWSLTLKVAEGGRKALAEDRRLSHSNASRSPTSEPNGDWTVFCRLFYFEHLTGILERWQGRLNQFLCVLASRHVTCPDSSR